MSNRRCRLFHVDAFTRQRFCGNPAIVVLDGDHLSEQEMQTIAMESLVDYPLRTPFVMVLFAVSLGLMGTGRHRGMEGTPDRSL